MHVVRSYVRTVWTCSPLFCKSNIALKSKVFPKRGWCLGPWWGENGRELSSKCENSLEMRCAVRGLVVRVLEGGSWEAEKGRKVQEWRGGSRGWFSGLPVAEWWLLLSLFPAKSPREGVAGCGLQPPQPRGRGLFWPWVSWPQKDHGRWWEINIDILLSVQLWEGRVISLVPWAYIRVIEEKPPESPRSTFFFWKHCAQGISKCKENTLDTSSLWPSPLPSLQDPPLPFASVLCPSDKNPCMWIYMCILFLSSFLSSSLFPSLPFKRE